MGRDKSKEGDELTDRQKDVYVAILAYIEKNGFPPSMRDIQLMLKLSSHSTAENHMLALVKKGWIAWEKDKTRAIRLIKDKVSLERLSDLAKSHSVIISDEPIRPPRRIVTLPE